MLLRKKRLLAGTMAALMCLSIAARAAEAAPHLGSVTSGLNFGFTEQEPGKTTVGVQVSKTDPAVLSFEVPLYMTVAVVNGTDGTREVLCPTNYYIRNLTTAPDGTPAPAAVTGLTVQGLTGGSWSLQEGEPSREQELGLSIGGVRLPAVSAGNPTAVPAALRAGTSAFFDAGTGQYLPISSGAGGTALAVEGFVKKDLPVTTDTAASAQFRCIYTISLLDRGGHAIGTVYDGPGQSDAVTSAAP